MKVSSEYKRRFIVLLLALTGAMILSFFIFEKNIELYIHQVLYAADVAWLASAIIISALAFDILLPIPSSMVALFAGATLGFWLGSCVIWLGLSLGCFLGYYFGMQSKRLMPRDLKQQNLQRADSLSSKIGIGTLVMLRAVPVLAEISVVAAGLASMPVHSFLLATGLANAGLAVAYAYLGTYAAQMDSFWMIVAGGVLIPLFVWLFSALGSMLKKPNTRIADTTKASTINGCFTLPYHYPVLFTQQVFQPENALLRDTLHNTDANPATAKPVLVFIDAGLTEKNPDVLAQIQAYFTHHQRDLRLLQAPQLVVGGEAVKSLANIEQLHASMLRAGLDRQGYVLAIGGGAVLDAVGFAAGTFHRGVRLVRMPSTVLAQNDAGVGVKNGINSMGVKNLIGCFQVPHAVINDARLLDSLSRRDRIAGLAEAVKVALIRDAAFFDWLESHADELVAFAPKATRYAIERCAQLHVEKITHGGDPFETGTARPLDYGHWSAHKLEALSAYAIRHGEAVAIGMALDARYAVNIGLLSQTCANRLIKLLTTLGFQLWHPLMEQHADVLAGLEAFRQHLGGRLCITLLQNIGTGVEVDSIQLDQMEKALTWLHQQRDTVTITATASQALSA